MHVNELERLLLLSLLLSKKASTSEKRRFCDALHVKH